MVTEENRGNKEFWGEDGIGRVWLLPLGLICAVFSLSFLLFMVIDYRNSATGASFLSLLVDHDNTAAANILGSAAEVVAAILGIAITVVAIIVELASTRYTSRVTDLFVRDRVNFMVVSLFVISTMQCLWTAASLRGDFVPTWGIRWTLALMSMSLLVLVPYFSYVFNFLQPKNIIARIRLQIEGNLLRVRSGSSQDELVELKFKITEAIEQIADIALNSILQRDRGLAMASALTLRGVLFDYFELKQAMPPAWFQIAGRQRENPDYVTLSQQGLEKIQDQRTWLEHKIFKQLSLVFAQSLNELRDLNNLIAMCFRDIGAAADKRGDTGARDLAVSFFNTGLRGTLNAKDVRTAYNVLHQYRQFCEDLIAADRTAEVEKVFNYLKYYGLLFESQGVGFILETVAYDLYRLTAEASRVDLSNEVALLAVFLEVDRAPDPGSSDMHLRGVRKAQAMLAATFLQRGKEDLARRIAKDMLVEPAERLESIRTEILTASPDFWEITDRGLNFDYLEESLRPCLKGFFEKTLPAMRAEAQSASTPENDEPKALIREPSGRQRPS